MTKLSENTDTIVLNVGGYETYPSTLTAYPNTLLGTMFQERNKELQKPTRDNEYFFDRNARAFHYIMEFYRTGRLLWNETSSPYVTREEIEIEFDYFQMPHSSSVQIENNRATIEDAAKLVEDFTEMMKSVIEELRKNFRTKICITFPFLKLDVFAIEPDLGKIKSLVKPFVHTGCPITSRFGDIIKHNLQLQFHGLECHTSVETIENDVLVYQWKIIAPFAFKANEILAKTNLKDPNAKEF
ncbi:13288_t:CDS:2 [Ambispora leptoticha]|uniref:13288_t:CDS:1 n=1 Tax=Ambispora leptoticha TaxID=144679 RepID=A0A9N9EY52_9GLOM|nr:13288_t:CDS:2 [Ambispora leptoticha]